MSPHMKLTLPLIHGHRLEGFNETQLKSLNHQSKVTTQGTGQTLPDPSFPADATGIGQ
jgi:hypothetical protein